MALVRDQMPSKWVEEALEGCIKVRGDVRDINLLRRVMAEYSCQRVFHLAAQAVVSVAQKDPVGTVEQNVMGTVNLLEACRQLNVEKLLVLSTDKIFSDQLAATEDSHLIPTEPYNTSKICQDVLARCWMITYGLRVVVPRLCNAFGYDLASRIVSNTIRSCLLKRDPIIFKGEEKNLRQYIYVYDAVDALIHLMNGEHLGVYNVATDDVISQEEVVLTILRHFKHLKPRYVERKEPIREIRFQSMNWDKLRETGWTPKHSFESGIKLTIDTFRRYGF